MAGVVEGHLDWDKVIEELNKRVQATQEIKEENLSVKSEKNEINIAENNSEIEFQYEPDEAIGWLIAAYILAFLGGIFGIVIGIMVWNQKIKLNDGEKVFKYKDSHRYMGLGAAILSIISIFVWKFAVN